MTGLAAFWDKSRTRRAIFWNAPWIGIIRMAMESSWSSRTILDWPATLRKRSLSVWQVLLTSSEIISWATASSPVILIKSSSRLVLTLMVWRAAPAASAETEAAGAVRADDSGWRIGSSLTSCWTSGMGSCVSGGVLPSAQSWMRRMRSVRSVGGRTGVFWVSPVWRSLSIVLSISMAAKAKLPARPTMVRVPFLARSSRFSATWARRFTAVRFRKPAIPLMVWNPRKIWFRVSVLVGSLSSASSALSADSICSRDSLMKS